MGDVLSKVNIKVRNCKVNVRCEFIQIINFCRTTSKNPYTKIKTEIKANIFWILMLM